jgi:3-oxoadipate enol-lactonase
MPRIAVNDINLYYEFHGPEDGEVIVLSNGIMMSTASWFFQTEALSKHFRVLLYDCRGMWKSDHPDGPYSMEMHADDLAGLLDALGIKKAHIAGISYGSEISLVFALRHPGKTKSLVVIDGVSEVPLLLKLQSYPWKLAGERNDAELLFHTSVFLNFGEEYLTRNEALLPASLANFAKLDLSSFVKLMNAFTTYNITDQLGQISCPTLIVVGEEDAIKGRKMAQIMVERISQAEYVVVPGAGHALCLDKPEPLNTLLLGFALKHSGQE